MLGVKDLGERSARPPVMCECNFQILSTGTLGLLRQKILDSGLRSSGNGAGVFWCGHPVKPVGHTNVTHPLFFVAYSALLGSEHASIYIIIQQNVS